MPIVSGGGGGGGGGVTPPVAITGTNIGTVPLTITGALGQAADILRVKASGGHTYLQSGATGALTAQVYNDADTALRADITMSQTAIDLDVYDAAGASQAALAISATRMDFLADAFTQVLALVASGLILTGSHAAPADGDLSAGDCALWFDQTNGAAKLMVKAKQANSTVVSAAIALA